MKDYFLGCDVSKGYADFVILDSNKQTVENNFQLDDTFEGHSRLYTIIQTLLKADADAKLYAGLESTGGYENNWYGTLIRFGREMPVNVSRLNPTGVHHSMKAKMNRTITDRVSARGIAEYLISHAEKVVYGSETEYSDLRKQRKFVDMLVKQKVQYENQLESLLYSANPELLRYCKYGNPQWLMQLLLKYPTAEKLSHARIESIKKIPFIKEKIAETVHMNARKSVASSSGQTTENLIVEIINQINHIEDLISKQTKAMAANCKLSELEILKSFKGIGDYSAIGLILEIVFIERFSSAKKLASYFGIHPVFKESGDGKSGMHMSKQGRRSPRAILFMVAFSSIVYNETVKGVYRKCLASGMAKNAAIGVCMHKILRIIYGMLKSNTKFDPAIDIANQQKTNLAKPVTKPDKNRRFQQMDESAPISRRQNKKRMAQAVSQNDNIIMNGITT